VHCKTPGSQEVALARKLATVLHRMWLDGGDFRFGKQEVPAAAVTWWGRCTSSDDTG
jgi:hypothetical protein